MLLINLLPAGTKPSVGAIIKAFINLFFFVVYLLPAGFQSAIGIGIIRNPVNHHGGCYLLSCIRVKYIPGIPNPADAFQHNSIGIKIITLRYRYIRIGLLLCLGNPTLTHQAVGIKIIGIISISLPHAVFADTIHKGLESGHCLSGL